MPLIEKRYAEALIALSGQNNKVDAVQQELDAVVQIWNGQPEFRMFLLSPEVKADAKKKVIGNIFTGQISQELVNFLSLLLDKGRIGNLPGILNEYIRSADKLRNALSITIISAAPLDPAQVDAILKKYQARYQAASAKVVQEIDPSLIGGVKVKIGDKVEDGTIQGRLESLKEILLRG